MTDTNAKTSPESEQVKESLVSNDDPTSESSGDLVEPIMGADFELDDDDLAMLFALGLC